MTESNVRGGQGARPCHHDRQWLARGRRYGARVRQALRTAVAGSGEQAAAPCCSAPRSLPREYVERQEGRDDEVGHVDELADLEIDRHAAERIRLLTGVA